MTILKGILTYTLILIGLIVGVGVILVGIMYFFPSVSIFGYKFYHGNSIQPICEVVSDDIKTGVEGNIRYIDKKITANLDAIEIDADNYDIEVAIYKGNSATTDSFRVEFSKSITGFVNKDDKEPYFTVVAENKELTGEETKKNVVTFKVNEPKGWYLNRNAQMKVWVADNIANNNLKDLVIKSGRGSIKFTQTFLAEDTELENAVLNVENLTIYDKANTADIKFLNINKKLKVVADSCNLSVDRVLSCSIDLNCQKGKYKFKDIEKTILNPNISVLIKAVNADVQFGKIDGNVTLRTDYGLFRAETINGSFSSQSDNEHDKNNACDLTIGKILGQTIIENGSGKIEIGQIGMIETLSTTRDLSINTKSGNITINNCFAKKVEITSERGAIKLYNALCDAKITTSYGSVVVDFMKKDFVMSGVESSAIKNAVDNLKTKSLYVLTGKERGDGIISVTNVMSKDVYLESRGAGNVYAEFLNLSGVNSISSSRGSAEVIVPDEVVTVIDGMQYSGFWLNWDANEADVYIFDYHSYANKSSSAEHYNDKKDAVYMGGSVAFFDNSTKLSVKANNKTKIYSAGHCAI